MRGRSIAAPTRFSSDMRHSSRRMEILMLVIALLTLPLIWLKSSCTEPHAWLEEQREGTYDAPSASS
jgi:hypothetical protein